MEKGDKKNSTQTSKEALPAKECSEKEVRLREKLLEKIQASDIPKLFGIEKGKLKQSAQKIKNEVSAEL